MGYDERVLDLLARLEEAREGGETVTPEEVCRDCPELLGEVKRRLEALAQLNRALDTDQDSDSGVDAPPGPETPGGGSADGGRYRPLRLHARGGLGEVFLARDEELHRAVALKRLQAHHAGDGDSRRRFLREAEITARLEHPGVVPVHGLILGPDDEPCYAMRFIEGQTLREAIHAFHEAETPGRDAGERRLTFRKLLGHFVAVCNTMAYAHSRGVLHRDLKPANVMLGRYGETLVVDWGLAKLVEREEAGAEEEETLIGSQGPDGEGTRTGALLGTPGYMSPEQAAGEWNRVGPASDVYSLGATLYCLLTDKAPMEGFPGGETRGGARGQTIPPPRKVRPTVPPALEAVCLKALASRPEDRYPSALALARDVEHYLADEPVSVRREPWGVRAWRWARKHRVIVTGSVAALAVAVVGLAVTAALVANQNAEMFNKNAELRAANEREQQAADLARRTIEDMTSDEALKFLESQKELRPEQRRFLEQALDYYRQYVKALPAGEKERARQARAYLQMGILQNRLGLHADAEAAFREAVEGYQQLVAEDPLKPEYHLDLARSRRGLGSLLDDVGKWKDSEAAYRAALQELAYLEDEYSQVPKYCQERAHLLKNLGNLLESLGKWDEAEVVYHAAIKDYQRLVSEHPQLPEYRADLAGSHNNLAGVLDDLGKWDKAEEMYRGVIQAFQDLVAEFPRVPEYRERLANTYNNLGFILNRLDKWDEAEAAYRLAITEQERLVAEHPLIPKYRLKLARSRNGLGIVLDNPGKRDKAEAEYRLALTEQKRLVAEYPLVPEYRQGLARTHNNLGFLFKHLGRKDEAEEEYRLAVTEQQRLAAEHPLIPHYQQDLVRSLNNLGDILDALGKREQAETQFRIALKESERLVGEHPQVVEYRIQNALIHNNLGEVIKDSGRRPEAEAHYRASVRGYQEVAEQYPTLPAYSVDLGDAYAGLGHFLCDGGEPAQALDWYTKAIRTLEAALPKLKDNTLARQYLANSLLGRALALAKLGQYTVATAEVEGLLKVDPTKGDFIFKAGRVFARSAATAKDAALAERYALRAVTLLRQAVEKGYKDVETVQKESDLDSLRARPDFQKLLQEMQKKK